MCGGVDFCKTTLKILCVWWSRLSHAGWTCIRSIHFEWLALLTPGGTPGANLKSISNRCYLREVAFEWKWTKETIYFPTGGLQGGLAWAIWNARVRVRHRGGGWKLSLELMLTRWKSSIELKLTRVEGERTCTSRPCSVQLPLVSTLALVTTLSGTVYLSISFVKSTPPQSRRLDISIGDSQQ